MGTDLTVKSDQNFRVKEGMAFGGLEGRWVKHVAYKRQEGGREEGEGLDQIL